MGSPPAVPRDAATVVLLRDGSRGPEAYLLRRVTGMAFAAGMTVFPGGSVDPADAVVETPWAGPPPAAWAARLGTSEALAGALVCAAVRETFEEAGVLLASPTADPGFADTGGPEWEADRVALEGRSANLTELLVRRGLVLRADYLRAWAHWITPEAEPRRFDTRFFVAALPEQQSTRDVGGEADRVHWMRPTDAVEAFHRGELPMMPPTALTLAEMSPYPSVADILAAAAERIITPIRPRLVPGDGPRRVLLPGDEGYDR
ncbi:MAG: NUDIX hydrolase [Actinomycetota bacterium]|nr:NUDIX hydrolase [Actinomycetota bacterium]